MTTYDLTVTIDSGRPTGRIGYDFLDELKLSDFMTDDNEVVVIVIVNKSKQREKKLEEN